MAVSEQAESLEDLRRKLARAAARRNWENLAEHAGRLRATYPGAWEADYYDARALVESGRYEQAEHLLQLAMDRFPRAAALPTLYGESGTRRLSKAAAVARWQTLLQRLPDEPNMYTGLAEAQVAAGTPDGAARTLQQGLAHLPDSLDLLEAAARHAWQAKDWQAALDAWNEVHRRAPAHPTASIFMIRALTRLQRLDEADALAQSEMERKPEDVELAVSYAGLAQNAGDAAEGVRRWRLVHAMAPTYPFGALGLARALAAQNEFAEAESVLKTGLEHNPGQAGLLAEYAANATRLQQPAEAVARYKAAYDHGPASARLYLDYIKALEQAEQFEAADELAAEAIGFAPDQLVLHRRYAGLATLRGNHAEALRRWQATAARFGQEEAVQTGIKRATAAVERDEKQHRKDDEKERARTPKSSIPLPAAIPGGRVINTGPTALDKLMTAAPAPPPVTPLTTGPSALDQLMSSQPATPTSTPLGTLRRKLGRLFKGNTP